MEKLWQSFDDIVQNRSQYQLLVQNKGSKEKSEVSLYSINPFPKIMKSLERWFTL